MGMSKLNIWIRDTVHPQLPYQSTGHSFVAMILSCETPPVPLDYGAVGGGGFALTDVGAGGGAVHGEVEVPPGTYLVRAWATCKNVWTNWAWVQVCCEETACVNLVTNRFQSCVNDTLLVTWLYDYAQKHGIQFSPGSEGVEIPEEVLKGAAKALERLAEHLPEDPTQQALGVTLDDLKRKLEEEAKKGN